MAIQIPGMIAAARTAMAAKKAGSLVNQGKAFNKLQKTPGTLVQGAQDISKLNALTKTAGIGALAGAGAADMTDGFTKAGSIENSIFANPEELGRQAAKAKMGLEEIMDKARGKAEELGQSPQLYMFQIQNGYQDEINKQQAMMAPPEEEGLKPVSLLFSGGGEASFPDLNNDGETTYADVLVGRGVYAEGGEAMSLEEELESIEYRLQVLSNRNKQAVANKDFNAAQQISQEQNMFMKKRNEILKKLNMPIPPKRLEPFKGLAEMAEGGEAIDDELAGMQMSEEDAMAEIQGIAPQAKMIEQLVMAVMQMVQQGIGEQEIIDFLKEQGLDDEDIEDLFTMVMQQMQQGQQDPIASELQEMS